MHFVKEWKKSTWNGVVSNQQCVVCKKLELACSSSSDGCRTPSRLLAHERKSATMWEGSRSGAAEISGVGLIEFSQLIKESVSSKNPTRPCHLWARLV